MSDSKDENGLSPKGIGLLITAKVVCCGVFLLAASGGLGIVSVWFFESGIIWFAATALLVFAGITLRSLKTVGRSTGTASTPNLHKTP